MCCSTSSSVARRGQIGRCGPSLSWPETPGLSSTQFIFAEVSIGFAKIEDVEAAIAIPYLAHEPISLEAAFLAGKAYMAYRKRGGQRRSRLPDFFIGAHAAVSDYSLVTR